MERFNESVPITEATVQELHLELIRRGSFNAFDGKRVVESLLAHRELWEAVVIDRWPYYFRLNERPRNG